MASDSKHRAFFEATRGPQRSYFGEQKASEVVLRMMFQSWIDGWLHGGAPLYYLKPHVLPGPPGLSGG